MIGTLFNQRYRIEAQLGQGGMGIVYRAHDTLLERDVAVKILSDAGIGTEGRARMLREAQAAARLNHPNIVSIFDAGEIDKKPFIIMELLEGESIYERKPDSLESILKITRQVCNALEHAHSHGIVHRDLKPENIIVTREGIAKLTDFGLARSAASRISVEGSFIGTIFYMAPEQALGLAVDGRADLYALGAILYELTTGHLPFSGDDPLSVISQHLHSPLIPPRTFKPDLPPALDVLIVNLLQKRAEDRPQTAGEVRQALKPDLLIDSASPTPISGLDSLVRGRLVAREKEFNQARDLWRHAVAGVLEQPVLLISGESGVGKTPLVREIRALAEVSGGIVLTDECYAEGSAPYAPIDQIVLDGASLPGIQLSDSVLADLITLSPALHKRFPQVMPNQPPSSLGEQQRLMDSVVDLCIEITRQKPLLLLIEDVQWADEGSLHLLRHLARRSRTAKLRLLIVLTYREAELESTCCLSDTLLDFNRERLAARIKLNRYNQEQTALVLKVMFQQEIEPEFVKAIFQETDGNLFFIEEICRALIEQGHLLRQDGRWSWQGLQNLQLPQSVRLAIQSRISQLPNQPLEILRMAAVIGREFDFETLLAASELDEETIIQALELALHAQLIREAQPRWDVKPTPGREYFIFEHGLIVTTLRESVSGLRRHRLHRRVASAIEQLRPQEYAVIAYHLQEAQDIQLAGQYYSHAGGQALTMFANREAERFYRTTLELTDGQAERAQALAGLGESLFRQSRYREAIQSWREAIELSRANHDENQAAHLYARTARAEWYAGDAPKGLETCLEALAAIPETLENPGMAALLHETARAYVFAKQPEKAQPLCQQALNLAERLGLLEVQAETLATLGIMPNLPFDQKRQYLERSIELAESARLLPTAARAHLNLGGRYQEAGQLSAARTQFMQAYELSRQMRMIAWEHDFLYTVMEVSLQLGELNNAQALFPELERLQKLLPTNESSSCYLELHKIQLMRYQGHLQDSYNQLQVIRERLLHNGQDQKMLLRMDILAGEILLEMGQARNSREILEQLIPKIEEDISSEKSDLQLLIAMTWLQEGQREPAKVILAEAQTSIKQRASSAALVEWNSAILAIVEQRWAEAWTRYQSVLARFEKMGMRWFVARVSYEWADHLINQGDPANQQQAIELYRRSLAIFESLPAIPYATMVKERLEALAMEEV
jgi:serine/threonine protein kinase/tetratricopeptide (TPR) repeat protein